MIKTVPLSKLHHSAANVRDDDAELNIPQLAASILSTGLLQNLVATPTKGKRGEYDVTAGGRRLRALNFLVERGDIKPDYEVTCNIMDASASHREISLMENFERQNMTPSEEILAFKAMVDEGSTIETIAQRFGITVLHVKGRLRLANLHPGVLAGLKSGKCTLDKARAYAATESHDRQGAVLERDPNFHWEAHSIRRNVLEASIKGDSPIALFVTEEAYLAAGGTVETDLFSQDTGSNWTNPELADQLADAKLAAVAAEIKETRKVGEVLTTRSTYDYESTNRLHRFHVPVRPLTDDEQVAIVALNAQIEENQAKMEDEDLSDADYTSLDEATDVLLEKVRLMERQPIELSDDIRGKLILSAHLAKDGTVTVSNNYYSREPLRLQVPDDGSSDITIVPSSGRVHSQTAVPVAAEKTMPDGAAMSQRLFDRLTIERRDILAANLMTNPGLALDYMIFSIAEASSSDTGLSISRRSNDDPNVGDIDKTDAHITLKERATVLNDTWKAPGTVHERFCAFTAIPDEDKAAWIAYLASAALRAQTGYNGKIFPVHNILAARLDIQTHEVWRPTAANYFMSIKKPAMLKLLDRFGGPELAQQYANAKKADLAQTLEKICAGGGIFDPEVKERALAWVPTIMSFTDSTGNADTSNSSSLEDDLELGGGDGEDEDDDALLPDDAFPDGGEQTQQEPLEA